MEVPVCMSSRELSSPQGRWVMGGGTGCLAACLTAPTPMAPQDHVWPPRLPWGHPVSPAEAAGTLQEPCLATVPHGSDSRGACGCLLAASRETVGEDTASG